MSSTLGVDELHKLPSELMYANFYRNVDNCKEYPFYEKAKSSIEKEEWEQNVSSKILNALCYVYNESINKKIDESTCNYLYYWLNDTIYTNIKFQLHSTLVIQVLNFLLQSIDGQNICKYDQYNINKENYKDIKILFDFSKDYDMLKKYFSNDYKFCNKDFQDYLYRYIRKYNEFKDICNKPNSRKEICSAFYNYFNRRTEENLSQWKCTLKRSNPNYATQKEEHARVTQPNVQGLNIVQTHAVVNADNNGNKEHEYVNQYANMNEDVHDLNHKQSEYFSFTKESQELSAVIDVSGNPSGSTSKSMAIPPLAIGISIFSIILCKFTPVGYWLKKALLGKSKRKRNIIIERNKIEDFSITEDLDSQRRFNISYSNRY
ncbi:variable surface protein [Plasmodium gonderi]|uniref:Variable surface protein n=1 Tax=Plasmodium gonderi TaxID=77519 RepID=A0A1Y1JPR8_PLAGO|nr:variable surface protein [Plasmodium gonderi]GAW84616.1 variable surface protein [Plasmodium gonderi]